MQFKNAGPKSGVSPPATNRGPKNHLFERLRNLTAILTAYIFGKHDIDNQSSALQLRRISYIVSKRYELWSTNGLKLNRSFYPLSVNSAFHFIAKLRRRTATNWTQPNVAKWWSVNHANKLPYKNWGRPSRKNWRPKNFYICSFFRRLRDVMANIC